MSITKHIPNTITSMNLLSGVMGVICAMQGEMGLAFAFMLAATVFDFCDGLSARLLDAYSSIGKELDSLADMVSFGVLPAIMLEQTMGESVGLVRYIPLLLAAFSALRLAKFNVDERQTSNFLGLPTPSSAMVSGSLCCYVYFCPQSFLAAWAHGSWFLPVLAIVLSLLLVSEIPMFGMKVKKGHKLLDAKRIVFLAVAVGVLAVTIVLDAHFSVAVFIIFSFYVLENLLLTLIARLRR